MGWFNKVWTLTVKNLLIVFVRQWFTTSIRAFWAPIIFMFFIGYSKNFFVPPANFGIGSPGPLRPFPEALNAASSRTTVAFVNNGLLGGQVEQVINDVANTARSNGKTVTIVERDIELLEVCKSSLRGASNCYGAASFHGSPDEGTGQWNYTIRSDGAFGASVFVDQNDNDAQIYTIPFQQAIDEAILRANGSSLTGDVDQYTFTSRTTEQRERSIQELFMDSLINIFGLAFYIGVCGVTYQLTGHMAAEREQGMSQLIEAMIPTRKAWTTQAARIASTHLAFDIIYLPGWIIMGVILSVIVFVESSIAVSLFYHILAGLSLTSFSIFGASLFKKAQLSGITITLATVILAIIAQVAGIDQTAAVTVLSLLFPPMNYVFFIHFQARFEAKQLPSNLSEVAPESPWEVPGYAFFILLVVQIIAFPLLGAFVERSLYGTADKRREVMMNSDSQQAVELSTFSKHYTPGRWQRWTAPIFRTGTPETVIAVNELSIAAARGHILALLGANGSGKSTTLNAISGLSTFNGGSIKVDGTGGLGYCPQKNVMWDSLTVEEHVRIFNSLKSTAGKDSKETIQELISSCDLGHKLKAQSKTLSGGQKRKLQLAMMFTGGSRVCCIDEISSGLDPVSRRKIWDILLAERGARTMILTTHFLDEADVLADQIAILSKGNLKAEGSAAELKHRLGGGYRIYINRGVKVNTDSLTIAGLKSRNLGDKTVYQMPQSSDAAQFVNFIEKEGVEDYQVTGPSIEDVFLKLAEEIKDSFGAEKARHAAEDAGEIDMNPTESPALSSTESMSKTREADGLKMTTGRGLGVFAQAWILFRKRVTILKRNYFPYIVALLLPIIAAGLVTLFLNGFEGVTCDPGAAADNPPVQGFAFATTWGDEPDINSTTRIVVGPSDRVSIADLAGLVGLEESGFHMVESLQEFEDYVRSNFAIVKPGGFFLGDTPTFAYEGDEALYYSVLIQNLFNNALTGTEIRTEYQTFAVPFPPSTGKTLQLILYFGLAMCAFPGFFALYPTAEKLRKVRALHYSNGIRTAPLWLAYLAFDTIFILLISVITIAIFVGASSAWYGAGYMFVCFFLYGLTSILIAYVVSLFATSQLAAFAVTAGLQCSMFLLYFIIIMCINTFTSAVDIDTNFRIANFAWNIVAPSGTLLQVLLLSLNQFQLLCTPDNTTQSYPGAITAYGGPILYLIVQAFLLLGFLIWWDSGSTLGISWLQKKAPVLTTADDDSDPRIDAKDPSVLAESHRVDTTQSPLQVQHVSKQFGKSLLAVQDITFGVAHSEVFALLGPNGAGKSTTISLIRGDLQPSYRGSDVLVEGTSITHKRAQARLHLGVCPQFDAMDTMTVTEHLAFYARARGVPAADVARNIDTVIQAVGLTPYTTRLASALSGGNQRKLSLAIALMGNPSVLLLDEPSSGMDAAAKRVMWRTLAAVSTGRALLITTHSMEEADALATRAGIMAQKMLAIGRTDELRERYGGGWYIHLVLFDAAEVSMAKMESVAQWMKERVPGARVQGRMMHGQIRVRVEGEKVGAGGLFEVLEREGREMGVEYYSIGRATLDQVFLEIIGPRDDE